MVVGTNVGSWFKCENSGECSSMATYGSYLVDLNTSNSKSMTVLKSVSDTAVAAVDSTTIELII